MTQQLKLREHILTAVEAFKVPDKKDETERMLHDVFVWQEICSMAEKNLKAAWAAAQSGSGVVEDDDTLRKSAGAAIAAESKTYSCVVKVDNPRESFDKDEFVSLVAAKYKLNPARVLQLAELAKKPTAAPLSKKIVCAS